VHVLPRVAITTEQIRAAVQNGQSILSVPAGAIITDDARELALRAHVTFVQPDAEQSVPWIGANWKMNHVQADVKLFCESLRTRPPAVDLVIFPPAVYLSMVTALLQSSPVRVGAQNVHQERSGAFTGETSARMVQDVGGSDVLVGHSERRQFFGETDAAIRAKLSIIREFGLRSVLCVGEQLASRSAGRAAQIVRHQLRSALQELVINSDQLVIAYEPVWAIGTGRHASADDVGQMHLWIRDELVACLGSDGEQVRIVYGGSVTPDSAGELAAIPIVQGFLIGGASLKSDSLLHIISTVVSTKTHTGVRL